MGIDVLKVLQFKAAPMAVQEKEGIKTSAAVEELKSIH